MEYIKVFTDTIVGMVNNQWNQIIFNVSWNENWFWGLIVVSTLVWALEIVFPWRKNQSIVRKDFWLDGMYMFFNFFIFQIGLYGIYSIFEKIAGSFGVTIKSIALLDESSLPAWLFIVIFFVLNDFVQWTTHVLLHRFSFLWNFHKVHHSIKEMGFAGHLRYHWMENLFYKPLKTFAVMILVGAEPKQAFFIHFFAVLIGHLNHANIRITWGPLKYIFNNSVMHLFHHAKVLPKGQLPGVNFGISLSIWDYIFKTNYIPQDQDGSYEIGWEGDENYPKHSFFKQLISGFSSNKK